MDSKAYAIEVQNFDFGILNARNQLISKIINPALDTLLVEPIWDHIRGSETSYSITIYLKARWDTPTPDVQ